MYTIQGVCEMRVCRSRFTSIAVDWRVLAADRRRYDVIFVGTGPRR